VVAVTYDIDIARRMCARLKLSTGGSLRQLRTRLGGYNSQLVQFDMLQSPQKIDAMRDGTLVRLEMIIS